MGRALGFSVSWGFLRRKVDVKAVKTSEEELQRMRQRAIDEKFNILEPERERRKIMGYVMTAITAIVLYCFGDYLGYITGSLLFTFFWLGIALYRAGTQGV